MNATKSGFPLFFGSTVVLGCFIGMMGSTGAMFFSSLGIMVNALTAEFGWGRGDVSFGATCLTLGIIVGMLTTGHLIDKYGSRRIVMLSVILSIIVVMTGPLYISTLPLFYLMLILGAIVGGPTNTVGYARVIACWFDRRRGLFIGITAAGMGVGFALVPWLTDLAINKGGWKAGYYVLGMVMFFVVLPAVFFFIKDKPEDLGMRPDGDTHGQNEKNISSDINNSLSLMEAAKTPTFCLLLVIIFSVAFALFGTLTQLVPMLTDRGVATSTAALVASSIGIGMTAARLGVGYLLDHVFAPRLAMIVFGLAIVGVLLITYSQYLPLYFLAAILIGFGVGAETDLMAYMVSRYYGMRNYALIFSCLFSSYMLGTGFGPYVFGSSFDIRGNYSLMLNTCIVLLMIAIGLLAFLAPYDRYMKKDC
jgi:MFS family permease